MYRIWVRKLDFRHSKSIKKSLLTNNLNFLRRSKFGNWILNLYNQKIGNHAKLKNNSN